ncbi:epithelial sodium channel subunit beta-like [Tachypleus tridentatus]|uniref:epithelial sodium channel subunit beta-like n=1 Tax=Tachypleus tridentatus TaxID=6853 RepID=UPI003FD47760
MFRVGYGDTDGNENYQKELNLKKEKGRRRENRTFIVSKPAYYGHTMVESNKESEKETKPELKTRKYLRVFVMICCLAGFLGHSVSFLQVYLEYPTVVEIKVENLRTLELPALTVCNNNRISKAAWCAVNPDICVQKAGETPKASKQKGHEKRVEKEYHKLNRSTRIELGIKKEEFVLKCNFENHDCLENVVQFYDYRYGNCYTLNAKWGSTSSKLMMATEWDPREPDPTELKFWLYLNTKDYTVMESTPRARFTIHSPYEVPKTKNLGMNLIPGYYYKYQLATTIVESLPPPYSTNCKEYQIIKERRVNATMTQMDCIDECVSKETTNTCGCTYERLYLLFGSPMCPHDDNDCLHEAYENIMKKCFVFCRKPCRETTYSIVASDFYLWPEYMKDVWSYFKWLKFDNITHARNNLLRLKIYYQKMIRTVYKHRPRYEPIEVFSVLGGYIGLWLGVSFSALYQYLETMIVQFVETCRKRRNDKPKYNGEPENLRTIRNCPVHPFENVYSTSYYTNIYK